MTCRTAVPGRLVLDTATLQFCAALARDAAVGMPVGRAHQNVAAAALRELSEEFAALAKALPEVRP